MPRICRVLVVEDDEGIQELLKDTFQFEGYRFALAGNAEEMRRILKMGDVDVCIIDMRLRGEEGGLVLAAEVLAKGCGVILMSGDSGHSDSVANAGHRFLAKPFRLQTLLNLVDDVLRETAAQCELKGAGRTAA